MAMPPTRAAPRRPGPGEPVEQACIDEGRVQAVEHFDEAFHHLPKRVNRLGKVRCPEPGARRGFSRVRKSNGPRTRSIRARRRPGQMDSYLGVQLFS